MKIKAILFDAGETLIYRNPSLVEITRRLLKRNGINISKEIISNVLNHCALKMKPVVEGGRVPDSKKWEIYINMVFKKLKIKDKSLITNLKNHLKKGTSFRCFPDTKQTLKYLKKMGFKLAIVSNASAEVENIFKRTGIDKFFDSIIVSEKVGYEKPDIRIFKKALKELNVLPEEAVFIGDNFIADIKGAIKAGIYPVWLHRQSKNNEFSYTAETDVKILKIKKLIEIIKLIKQEGWN
jgi:putative hydrolase of the HAD superfamily